MVSWGRRGGEEAGVVSGKGHGVSKRFRRRLRLFFFFKREAGRRDMVRPLGVGVVYKAKGGGGGGGQGDNAKAEFPGCLRAFWLQSWDGQLPLIHI